MKFTKKIFVGLIVAALLISCLAFTATADFTEANIEDILEYYTCDRYAAIDYEDLNTGKYTAHHTETEGDGFSFSFNRIDSDTTDKYTVVEKDGNKMLQIANPAPLGVRYEFGFAAGELDTLVTSVRYKTSAGEAGAGSTFNLFIYAHDEDNLLYPNPRLRTLSIKCDADDPSANSVEYLSVVDGAYYEDTILEGFTPALDTWYTIESVYNLPTDSYTITITPDGGEAAVIEGTLGTLSYVDTAYIEVRCTKGKTNNLTWLDDVEVYEGTFVRDNSNINDMTADTLLNLEALAKETDSAVTKVRIAHVLKYVVLEGGYIPSEGTPDKAKVEAAIEWAKSYVYPTYFDSVISCVADIDTNTDYYTRNEYAEFLEGIDAVIPDDADAIKNLVADADTDAILAAKEAIRAERKAVDKVAAHSEAFLATMLSYDKGSKNYDYVESLYAQLTSYTDRDSEYKYTPADRDEEIIYATVGDAEVDFDKFAAKRNSIYNNVQNFFEGIAIMESTPDSDFKNLYKGYVLAHDVYADGVIDTNLDNETCDGLLAAIDKYPALTAKVEARIAPCDEFIRLVNMADISMYHSSKKEYITSAYLYIDDNTAEYIVEPDYPGITEAKAKFTEIRNLLETNLANATAYINAVAAIDNADTFAAKKTAVAEALALKATGDIIGVDGVVEANMALAAAESYVTTAEGASATLISVVNELLSAKTLEKRMELINTANRFVDLAEESISGVTSAKASLASAIEAYNNDVKALNSAFSTAVVNGLSIGA